MRLIDAEALKRNLCETCNQEACDGMPDSISECYSVRIIDEQPTAYDVDKVVEEFERRFKYHLELSNRDFTEHGRAQAYRSAIDVVKRGGIE